MSVKLKRLAAKAIAPLGAYQLRRPVELVAGGGKLLLLGYHRILPLDRAGHDGDLELISATPDEFRWQMQYLADRFEPVSFARIAETFDGGPPLPKRAVAVTFDDGFYDLHAYALPMLRQTGMTATVFVATDYVDHGGVFWFDHVAWALANNDASKLPLPESVQPLLADHSVAGRQRLIVAVLRVLKDSDEARRHAYVTALLDACPLPPDITLGRALNWDEIRDMSAAGIEFGSHTASHRCLSRLSRTDLEHELRHSKQRIEQETGKPVAALAYPFGGRSAFNREVVEVARSLGYRLATTYVPGVNRIRSSDPFALLRQHVERDTSRDYFEALVNFPELFS
jgi:peptidoglycan/xylan/chitin deacetylase (PgdA/CDA1 family)